MIPPQGPKKPSWRDIIIAVIAAAFLMERFAPENYKPSTLYGGFTGHEEAVALRTKLAETQAILAAQNEENARMQQEVEYFKARTERVTKAYEIIYQRTNMMAQAMANLEQEYLTMRQKFATELEGGKAGVAMLADMTSVVGKMLGNKEWEKAARDTADEYRNEAKRNVDAERNRGLAEMSAAINAWRNGLPDPATIINENNENPLQPAPRKAAPAKPAVYSDASPQPVAAQPNRTSATVRLARVNNRFPNLFVRSAPKGGLETPNKICALPQGATVALLEDGGNGRMFDADTKITFLHVRFTWQGHGETTGWASEKALEEFSGSARDAKVAQSCEPII